MSDHVFPECAGPQQSPSDHYTRRLVSLIEHSPVVVATWRNIPGWPISYVSRNILQFGYSPDDFHAERVSYMDLIHPDDHRKNTEQVARSLSAGPDAFRLYYRFRHADGHWIWLEDHTWLVRDVNGVVTEMQGVLVDVSRQRRAELMNAAQVRLMALADGADLPDLLQRFLDEAELLTDSSIGFCHFVDEEKGQLELRAWSSNTRKAMRAMAPEDLHYPAAEGGVWADAVRERRPIIHDDPVALTNRRDPAQGRAGVARELVVPVLRGGEIVALLGVGNKPSPYVTDDVEAVRKLAELAWEIVARKQSQAALTLRTQELERMARYDPLTGLPNRSLLTTLLQQAMAQVVRRGTLLAVVFIDLDGFKQINDRHGHAVGDQVLRTVADRFWKALRRGDTVARLGGDEFVAILFDLPGRDATEPLLKRLLLAASQQSLPPAAGSPLELSASLGVTFFPQSSKRDAEQLVRESDQAMYRAKLAGKNRFCIAE
jgi:diguanylate cyclase (GGDEF)-like protein/PAS domain S-box-containing protein